MTWNCQTGFAKKADALLSLRPDVAVVPECSQASTAFFQSCGYEANWFGANPRKGLAVACRGDWSLRIIQQPEHYWIVPLQVNAPQPFTLIAVWACRVGTRKADNYVGQIYQALNTHPEWFGQGPVVVAGDFNSSKIWDIKRPVGNHSAVVKLLDEHGLVSGYHACFNEKQGPEAQGTFYLFRHEAKPYHIDYIFVPKDWVPGLSVKLGKYSEWSRLSDHCPVIADTER